MNQSLDQSLPTQSPKSQIENTDIDYIAFYSTEKSINTTITFCKSIHSYTDEKNSKIQDELEVSLEQAVPSLDDLAKAEEFNPNCCSLNEIDTGTNLSENGVDSRLNFERLRKTLQSITFLVLPHY